MSAEAVPAQAREAPPVGPFAAAETLAKLLRNRKKLLADAERLRRLRVATRRVGLLVLVGNDCMGRRKLARLDRRLRTLRRGAGAVRDVDVALRTLSRRTARVTGVAAPIAAAARRLRVGPEAALREMLTGRRRRRIARAGLALARAVEHRCSDGAVPDVVTALHDLYQGLRLSLASDLNIPDNLHRARRRLKSLRYGLEVLAPLLRPEVRQTAMTAARAVSTLQTDLGRATDLRLAANLAEAAAPACEPEPARRLLAIARNLRIGADREGRILAARLRALSLSEVRVDVRPAGPLGSLPSARHARADSAHT